MMTRFNWTGGMLLGVVASGALASIVADGQEAVKVSGLFLQLLGLLTVAIGLGRTRQFFGHRPSWLRPVDWLCSFIDLFREKKTRAVHLSGTASGTSLAEASLSVSRSPDSVEERLELLEGKVARLQKDVEEKTRELSQQVRSAKSEIRNERTVRERGDKAIEEQMEELSVGGLRLEAMGVWWLALGLIAATVPGWVLHLF